MFDLRFKTPSTFIFAGASSTGKTTTCFNILKHGSELFDNTKCIENVFYFYKVWQPIYSEYTHLVKKWLNEVPTEERIQSIGSIYKDGSIVIIDDFGQNLNADMVSVFNVLSHHLKINVFLLIQNLYPKQPFYRELSLNAKYIFIFKNTRDKTQIQHFARQFSPNNIKYVIQSYVAATEKPYSYLLIDLHQSTNDLLRLRSSILPEEFPMKVWAPKSCKKAF